MGDFTLLAMNYFLSRVRAVILHAVLHISKINNKNVQHS